MARASHELREDIPDDRRARSADVPTASPARHDLGRRCAVVWCSLAVDGIDDLAATIGHGFLLETTSLATRRISRRRNAEKLSGT
jgi:hypothetical protein